MNAAAGGLNSQAIVKDPNTYQWDSTQTKVFNVQILNSQHFQTLIGVAPPTSPVDGATYAQYGFPFFSIYEEPTAVSGDFSMVRSVAQIDGISETALGPHRGGFRLPVGLLPCR